MKHTGITTFEALYKELNPEQREAVDTLDGPVIVAAGPGTGKTHMLALRIANILRLQKAQPEQILALTFTDSAATAMKQRLRTFLTDKGIGRAGTSGSLAYQIAICTFHSFCNDVISSHPEEFAHMSGEAISEIDQIALIAELVDGLKLHDLRPFGDPHYFVRDIRRALEELKREGVTPEELSRAIDREEKDFAIIDDLRHAAGPHKGKMKGKYQKLEKDIRKHKELLRMYNAYQQHLREHRQFDFNDMILSVVSAFQENESLLQDYQERFTHILVDEHQDTNRAQNKVIAFLCAHSENPNLFVVGDDKQAIYRFQGASVDNFLYFKHRYPRARFISLRSNYRSDQKILDASMSLISHNTEFIQEAGAKLLSARREEGLRVVVFQLASKESEYQWVLRGIQDKIANGANPHEIAILARNNADILPLASLLETSRIPYSIESQQDILGHPAVRDAITLIQAVVHFGEPQYLIPVLHIGVYKLDPLDTFRFIQSQNSADIFSLYDTLTDASKLLSLNLRDHERFVHVGEQLSQWASEIQRTQADVMFTRLIRESGLLDSLLSSPSYIEHVNQLAALYDEIKKIMRRNPRATLIDVAAYIDTMKSHNYLLKRKIAGRYIAGVRLMTAHGAKGLEFDHVFIIHAISGVWSKKRGGAGLSLPSGLGLLSDVQRTSFSQPDSDDSSDDDDRRLFYVAMTRARKSVTITYASYNEDGREQLPTQFLDEIDDESKTIEKPEDLEQKFSFTPVETKKQQKPNQLQESLETYRQFIAQAFNARGLNATALNTYLECPWRYLYVSLLRVPMAETKHQRYGKAIHAALSDIMDAKQRTKQQLLQYYERALKRQPVTPEEYKELLQKGTDTLGTYFDTYAATWPLQVQTEVRMKGVILDDIPLTGILDRVEYVELATGESDEQKLVRVIDYKTGKRKTRNALLGKTAAADINYYRQLVFYKLLLDLDTPRGLRMREGVIDFVEPAENGTLYTEQFEIDTKETSALTELLRKTAHDISTLAFWDYQCKDKDKDECEWCKLGEQLRGSLQKEVNHKTP
ncbi:MAG: hypothetical protein A2666_01400 [Parcubacteria group bacterium RIFCSPHIGHO2_01_FULL_47_10b]|nr:MAG: hypothetical protein A2666_01400 [Parcubacteria group bacterium RIFCSPHIGHO2_01_FULL_47_10b]